MKTLPNFNVFTYGAVPVGIGADRKKVVRNFEVYLENRKPVSERFHRLPMCPLFKFNLVNNCIRQECGNSFDDLLFTISTYAEITVDTKRQVENPSPGRISRSLCHLYIPYIYMMNGPNHTHAHSTSLSPSVPLSLSLSTLESLIKKVLTRT